MSNVLGKTFEEMSIKEMESIQGSGDMEAETTILTPSSVPCIQTAGYIGSGITVGATIVLSIKKC